ncbi:hypothetical protein GE253_12675 [Niveispirillum sp. SYP-B3756]|uniref:hypothetical protein n=1 Tax=Niveispirillum sp. SYP-B3756 TaxID=2662178 RepID=UPI001291C6FF|nr:hypothetical protein [Niveispirillum sp. SYP-B3756]MQP66196.1 hypothetical protein [Niveispirillum sp. SYP-B3756]
MVRVPGMGRERVTDGEPMPPLQRFDPMALPSTQEAGKALSIDLPVLRGGAAAAGRPDNAPVPDSPAPARRNDPPPQSGQQPLPAWVGHVMGGGR